MTWLTGGKTKGSLFFNAPLRGNGGYSLRGYATLRFFLCPRTFLMISTVVECFKDQGHATTVF
ncbi:hypothetical protein LR48_Vigan04g195800 [Vigna angularis]|uniref:Uncharacterized protein n=1 Tax=Phaseolus angularis TaxID=3914 RepID=A0A0L9UFS2_PHAAN|nr:hypothetical protein LR48_Vigan04g195800 [Vigna angularis]